MSQIHTGMRGVAYTVFEGIKPESMDVEVLGVLHNMNGPKGDVILVRLHGTKVEYTGVVAGMSGSPVYLNGKLAGAIAFRIGEFSKEPIAGVTPIADMLEIDALDKSPSEEAAAIKPAIANAAGKTSGPGDRNFAPRFGAGFRALSEAHRRASRIQWIFRRSRSPVRAAVCYRRSRSGDGRWLDER